MSTMMMSKFWPLLMPPTAKAVLISLADQANDHGHCWPSLATICKRTCHGRTAVIDAIHWLEANGFVAPESRGPGRGNEYWLSVPQVQPQLPLPEEPTRPAGEPVREADGSGTQTGVVRQADPHQSGRRTSPVRQADPNRNRTVNRTVIEPESGANLRSPHAQSVDGEAVDKQRGHRLPPAWEPGPQDQQFALNRLGPDWREALAAFRDHFGSAPGAKGRKVDWSATFRNWIRKDARDAKQRSRAGEPAKSQTLQAIETLLQGKRAKR